MNDATTANQRTSSRSSMLIAEWIMKKVMNDNTASTATEAPTTTGTPPSSCDTILQQLLDQASDVRRTFEQSPSASKRKLTVSSATAAAALHMASINRKRKFESRLPSSFDSATTNKTSNTFQRPISMYPICVTTSEKKTHAAKDVVSYSFVSKQILPKDLTYNDVVFFGPDYDTSHVGNQRYKVWINIHKSSFAQASTHYDKTLVAMSLVDTVMSSVPSGRFFSVSMHDSGTTDLRYNKLGYDKSVDIVMESLNTAVGDLFKSMIIKKESSEDVVLEVKKRCDMPPLKQTADSWDSKEARRLATTTVKEPVFRRSSMISLDDCTSHSK